MINRLPSDEDSPSDSVDSTLPLVQQASDEQIRKKEELLRLLKDVEPKAEKIENLGKDIVKSARLSRDVASPLQTLVSEVPAKEFPVDKLDLLIDSWSSWHEGADKFDVTNIGINSFSAISFSTASTESTVFSEVDLVAIPSPISRKEVEKASDQFQFTLSQSSLLVSVQSAMRRLGLDVRNEKYQKPQILVAESCEALDRPIGEDGGAVSVLIPLRESVSAVISELLKRRTVQEATPKLRDKIMSLGRQCARANLNEDHFKRLAKDAEVLNDDLSEAKQAKLPRARLKELLNRGLLFLNALLASIDENRLRKLPS